MASDRPGVFQGDSWWATYRAHGDPFPLAPHWIELDEGLRDLTFPQRGAWAARALNTLALQDPNSNFDQKLQHVPPNFAQQSVVRRIVDNLVKAGDPPEGMTGVEALNSMSGGEAFTMRSLGILRTMSFRKSKFFILN